MNEPDIFGKTPYMQMLNFLPQNVTDQIVTAHAQYLNRVKQVFQISAYIDSVILEDWLKLKVGTHYWIRHVDTAQGLVMRFNKRTLYMPAEIVNLIDVKIGPLYGLQHQDWANIKTVFFKSSRVTYDLCRSEKTVSQCYQSSTIFLQKPAIV